MNSLNNNNFKFKITEWRGYIVRVVEDIDKHMIKTEKRLDKIDSRLSHLRIKMASIGGGVAVIFSVLLRFLLK